MRGRVWVSVTVVHCQVFEGDMGLVLASPERSAVILSAGFYTCSAKLMDWIGGEAQVISKSANMHASDSDYVAKEKKLDRF